MIVRILLISLLLVPHNPLQEPLTARLGAAETTQDSASTISVLAQLTDTLPTAPLQTLQASLSLIVQAASNPDPHIRSLALLDLIALTTRTKPDGSPLSDALPLLEPYLPGLTQHLLDPDPAMRELTALFLGGFRNHPTSAVISPLLSVLASPAAPGPFALSVIVALLNLDLDTRIHPDVPRAILTFLLRSDAPPDLRLRILNAIASHPSHSLTLDTDLLVFLGSPQPTLIRAGLIHILPRLLLSPADLQATQTRLRAIAIDPAEDPVIRSSAAEVLSCWHAPRMTDPCPAPAVRYRALPPPPKSPITPPRYQSPPLSLIPNRRNQYAVSSHPASSFADG